MTEPRTRTLKTEQQRAQEALEAAQRKHDRASQRVAEHQALLPPLERDRKEAALLLAYARQHPLLQEQDT